MIIPLYFCLQETPCAKVTLGKRWELAVFMSVLGCPMTIAAFNDNKIMCQ